MGDVFAATIKQRLSVEIARTNKLEKTYECLVNKGNTYASDVREYLRLQSEVLAIFNVANDKLSSSTTETEVGR